MVKLTHRGPNANAPARLPAVQAERIKDENVRQAVEALREWVEVRLGSRGDYFERAVTFRDLSQVITNIENLQKQIERIEASEPTTTTVTTPAPTTDLTAINNAIAQLQAAVVELTARYQTLQFLPEIVFELQDQVDRAAYLDRFNTFQYNYTAETEFNAPDGTNTVYIDAAASRTFVIPISANTSVARPDNLVDGLEINLVFQQDETGGHGIVFTSDYDFGTALIPTINTTALGVTLIRGIYVQDLDKVLCTAQVGGSFGAYTQGIGSASGTSAATGLPSRVPGSVAGTSTVSGVGASIQSAVGSAAGTCSVSGFQNRMVGSAAGTSTALGRTNQGVGSSSGASSATGRT